MDSGDNLMQRSQWYVHEPQTKLEALKTLNYSLDVRTLVRYSFKSSVGLKESDSYFSKKL